MSLDYRHTFAQDLRNGLDSVAINGGAFENVMIGTLETLLSATVSAEALNVSVLAACMMCLAGVPRTSPFVRTMLGKYRRSVLSARDLIQTSRAGFLALPPTLRMEHYIQGRDSGGLHRIDQCRQLSEVLVSAAQRSGNEVDDACLALRKFYWGDNEKSGDEVVLSRRRTLLEVTDDLAVSGTLPVEVVMPLRAGDYAGAIRIAIAIHSSLSRDFV